MALGEKTVLDLFTEKTGLAGEAPWPGAAFLFVHKFAEANLNTDKTPAVIFVEPRGAVRGSVSQLGLSLLGFGGQAGLGDESWARFKLACSF